MNINKLAVTSCLIVLMGCQPTVFNCVIDGIKIENLEDACILTVNTEEKELSSSRMGEQYYEVVSLKDIANETNVPIEDLAFMYKEELYCTYKCAEKDRTKKK